MDALVINPVSARWQRRIGTAVLGFVMFASGMALTGCSNSGDGATAETAPLTVYSARNEQLIGPILAQFTEQTGITTALVTADAGPLLERLKAEGDNTPADILITVDAGNLWQAAAADLLLPLDSAPLRTNVPAHLRDPDNRWFGLSIRARTLVHHTGRAPADTLGSYVDLADPRFKGRLCLRTSRKVYNQSLVGMLIAEYGEERTETIVRGWVANLAAPPFPNDTAVMEAIQAGLCDVGIVNTYYFGRLQRAATDPALALYWPDQDGSGVHVNVAGAGVVRGSDQPGRAQALIEWLSAPEAQSQFAGINLEYPVHPDVDPVAEVARWGTFRQNLINVSEAGERQPQAVKLMDRAGYR